MQLNGNEPQRYHVGLTGVRKRSIEMPDRFTSQMSTTGIDTHLPAIAKGPHFRRSQPFSNYIKKVERMQKLRKSNKMKPGEFMDKLVIMNGHLQTHRGTSVKNFKNVEPKAGKKKRNDRTRFKKDTLQVGRLMALEKDLSFQNESYGQIT